MLPQSKVYRGYLGVFGALAIWTSWMILTRHASSTSLSGAEIAALRFFVSGILVLPIAIKRFGKELFNYRFLALGLLMGAPYILFAATGMKYSPAAHAATFINGAMVTASIVFSIVLIKSKPSLAVFLGVLVVIIGLFLLGRLATLNIGDMFFIISGSMWAMYSVLLQKWAVPAIKAVVAVNIWSFLLFAIPYLILFPDFLFKVPVKTLVTQAIFQGVFASILAHLCFATAVQYLGATKVSLFVPTVPALTGLIEHFALGQPLHLMEWFGIALVTVGILLTKVRWSLRKVKDTKCCLSV